MNVIETFSISLQELGNYLFDPSQRIYLWYLLGAVLLAIPVFWLQYKVRSAAAFARFLFPQKIWLAPSAKQDYVILIINKLIRGLLLAPVIIAIPPIAIAVTEVLEFIFNGTIAPISESGTVVALSFTILLFVLDDLSRFLLHWALHKVPFLWEIHKVHHSAKVLTPFTIYRSHPIENYLFASRLALSQGLAIGIGFYLFSTQLTVIDVAGANIFVFAFNFLGSNLRHSHIKLSWGPTVERWLISPVQHQIHHSDNPRHFDRNLGSALAIWDRMAGTLVLANQVGRIRFGVGRNFKDHDQLHNIYWLPIKRSMQKLMASLRITKPM